jgi:hypothetical protein
MKVFGQRQEEARDRFGRGGEKGAGDFREKTSRAEPGKTTFSKRFPTAFAGVLCFVIIH